MISLIIDISILITLLVVAFRAAISIRKNHDIFAEYNQSTILALLVLIDPLGPLLLILGSPYIPKLYLFTLVIACFIPQLIIGRRQNRVFELSGTDKTDTAREALSIVNVGALIGLIYTSVYIVIHVSTHSLDYGNYGT